MNTYNKTASISIMSLLMLLGTGVSGANENTPVSPSDPQLTAPAAPVFAGGRVLKHTKIISDNALVAVGSSFQPLHPATGMNCPGATTCTLTVEQNVQVKGASAGKWAICTKVDGVFLAEPLCPFLGSVPADGSYIAGSFAQSARNLAPGMHSVQTFVYTDGGGDLSIYNIVYRIYQP